MSQNTVKILVVEDEETSALGLVAALRMNASLCVTLAAASWRSPP